MNCLVSGRAGTAGRLLMVLVLAAGVALFATDAAAQGGILQGVVTAAADGAPIAGALVIARADGMGTPGGGHGSGSYMAITDASGGYAMDGVRPGDYELRCGAPGFRVATAVATVVGGQTSLVDFTLEALTFGSVAGFVTDATSGDPVAGAHVMLFPAGGPEPGGESMPWHGMTGDDGAYRIDHVPAGEYLAAVHAWGFVDSDPAPVTVADGQTSVADFALEPISFGALEGVVTDAATGAPIVGAVVHIRPAAPGREAAADGNGGDWHHAITDDNGGYRFESVAAGSWQVHAFARSYQPAESTVEVVADQTAVLDLALTALSYGRVAGYVTDAVSGEPIAGAMVRLYRGGQPARGAGGGQVGSWSWGFTDLDGGYLIENVPTGDYVLVVNARFYQASAPLPVTVLDGQTVEVDVALQPLELGSLEGTVTDAVSGAQIEGATVAVFRGPGGDPGDPDHPAPGRTVTDADGHYAFDRVMPGTWSVMAIGHGYQRGRAEAEIVAGQTAVVDLALTPR